MMPNINDNGIEVCEVFIIECSNLLVKHNYNTLYKHDKYSYEDDRLKCGIIKIRENNVKCGKNSAHIIFTSEFGGIYALTLSDPGYFRQLTIRGGGGFKSPPPPYDLENYCVNLHHIIHVNFTRCFWHDLIGIFQKFAILTILQRFQNKK